jgi:di/tricarboxylate transporter
MVPVGLSAATQVGADPRTIAIAVMIAASCSFLTPIGYQTNLMVYGLGGYRFTDFARVGLPLTLTVVVMSGLLIPIL